MGIKEISLGMKPLYLSDPVKSVVEVLEHIWSKASPNFSGENVRGLGNVALRETRSGDVIVELGPNTMVSPTVRYVEPQTRFEPRDLVQLTTDDKVTIAVNRTGERGGVYIFICL